MPWDANWATTQAVGKLQGNALEQIRLAFIERAGEVNVATPTGWTTSWAGRLPNATILSDFQTSMTTLIGSYVNHTLTFEGSANIPNQWTSATISALTTNGSRINAPTSGQFLREWIWQQYEILNLLRWIRFYDTYGFTITHTWVQKTGDTLSGWNNAKSDVYAKSWVDISDGRGSFRVLSYDLGSSTYQIILNNYKTSIAKTTSLQYSLDRYCKPLFQYSTFSLDGIGTDSVYYKQSTLSEGNGTRLIDYLPDSDYVNTVDALTPGDNYMQCIDDNLSSAFSYYIAKFDGANGFTYKDW